VNYATHGQLHDYDTQVPIIFWGPGIARGRRAGEARVVDMAPTLAALLGVPPLEALDGRALPLRP
jgi:arylsulfatase A-like enzyme